MASDGTPTVQVGDILAVRGQGFLARGILLATGNTVSHVGMVIGAAPGPDLVIEALWRVKTRPISVSLQGVEKAWILSDLTLSAAQRGTLVKNACVFSADTYGWWDIILQLADALAHTTYFTDHFSFKLSNHPICSYLVAKAYQSIGLNFGRILAQSITPADIFNFASTHPAYYSVTEIL